VRQQQHYQTAAAMAAAAALFEGTAGQALDWQLGQEQARLRVCCIRTSTLAAE
jgi:hypothetical protein